MNQPIKSAGAAAAALLATVAPIGATALVVDVDPALPGIQTTVTVTLGAPVVADVYLISDGVTPMDAYGVNVEYNDTPGILGLMPPTMADPPGVGITVFAGPGLADLATLAPVGPGAPLGTFGFGPLPFPGPGGPFTASDGGAGMFTPPAGVGGLFFGAPIPAAGTVVLLETVTFMSAAIGVSDVAPFGIMVPAAAPGIAGPGAVFGPGGLEFYDSFTGLGIAAAPVPISGFAGAINPGTVTVVPETGSWMLLGIGLLGWALRRRNC